MNDRLKVLPQYLLPKQALTRLAGRFAEARAGRLSQAAIRWFIGRYGVNMAEAENPDPASYRSFNEFFTRSLKADARPFANAEWLCPVDGTISQFGDLDGERLLQAKGHTYTAQALVGGDAALATYFAHGSFACLYLSPRDYHRIHMPCDARVTRMIHVPGELFSVNPVTARGVPGLFARNERVVCVFDGAQGPFVMVLVGATIVGSVEVSWYGRVTPPRSREPREWCYRQRPIRMRRGDEMGRFQLGSTVIMLFPHRLRFNPAWTPGRAIRMGEAMSAE